MKRNKKYYIKALLAFLFVNATTEDFKNPIQFIDRYISFLNDSSFFNFYLSKQFTLSNSLDEICINIFNSYQNIMMETPNKMEFIFLKKITKMNFTIIYLVYLMVYQLIQMEKKKVAYIV